MLPFPAGRAEVNRGTLTIKNLIPADNGLYECVATNIIGTKKARINVAVQLAQLQVCLMRQGRGKARIFLRRGCTTK